MKKYSDIALSDEEKKNLEWFKEQGYTHVGRTTQYGFVEVFDENNDIQCNLKPMRKPFEFIDNGERYEIEKLLNPPHEPKTVWDLENGDAFWWVDSRGIINKDTWENYQPDYDRRSQGNAFITKEEAEFEAKRREVVAKVRKYTRPYILNELNCFPCYDHRYDQRVEEICVDFDLGYQESCLYFDSESDIKKAIKEVGEEDFKKYYLGVVEDHDRK